MKFLIPVLIVVFTTPVFAQNADMSLIPYRQGDLWGYATPDKQVVIKPVYNEANLFYEGYASVKKGTKYGYIDKVGKVVIPFKFYVAKPFRLGYVGKSNKIVTADDLLDNQNVVLFAGASLRADGYEVCIDTKGQTMRKCPAIPENSAPDLNKPTTVTLESNYSTIQRTDLFDKITEDYKIAGSEDTYYVALKGNNYGVFNNKFEVIVPFEYTMIKKWNNNNSVYLEVQKNELKGLLSANGSVSIAVDNNNFLRVRSTDRKNYFIVSKNGKAGIKDADNNDIVPSNYTDILYDQAGGFVLVGNNNQQGFFFLNNHVLEPKYTDVKLVKGGEYVMVRTQTGKTGFVNNKGDEFFVE